MYASQSPVQPPKPTIRWLSILQLTFSALAAVLLIGAALVITIVNLVEFFFQGSAASDPTTPLMIASSLAFAGCIAVPSAWYAWKHLAHVEPEPVVRPERKGFSLIFTLLVFVVVMGSLWLGSVVSQDTRISWFLLPTLNILATGLPALWLVYMGTHGFIPGKPARKWGVFASALILSPIVILVLELLALLGIGIVALVWIMLDPNLASQLNSLAFRVQNSGANPEVLLRILLPFLLNPVILVIGFVYISVIVPILEEVLKPFAIWLMAGLKITPAQGFAYGVLCGVGFGLFENLGNTSGGGETWVLLASARISTLLLHGLNTGMVGWALASAWSQKRYLRLGLTFLYAILMHGLWNGLAVLSFVSSLESMLNVSVPPNLVQLGGPAAIGIVTLGAFNLVFFLGFSRFLRKSLPIDSSSKPLGSLAGAKLPEKTSQPANPPASPPGEDFPPASTGQGKIG